MNKGKKKMPALAKVFLSVSVGIIIWTAIVAAENKAAQACGGSGAGSPGASSLIVHQPTISAQTIDWELQQHGSPLSSADAADIYQQSQRYTIDDAFALGLWNAEDNLGTSGVAAITKNIGNMLYSSNLAGATPYTDPNGYTYAEWSTWQQGIDAWFAQAQSYVKLGLNDLTTYTLYYVHGIFTLHPASAQQQLVASYDSNIQTMMQTLQQHEGQQPGESSPQGATLASLIPTNLLPGWAGAGALQAAAQVPLDCNPATGSNTGNPLVVAAMQLAAHLLPDGTNFFDRWGPGTPSNVISNGDATQGPSGVASCTDFVASAYQVATGKRFPVQPYGANAGGWLVGPVGSHPGFEVVQARPGSFPQAGDIIVLQDGGAGHVAIAVGVQQPQAGQDGWVLVAQGNSIHPLEKWALFGDGILKPPWPYKTLVPGYIRIPALAGGSGGFPIPKGASCGPTLSSNNGAVQYAEAAWCWGMPNGTTADSNGNVTVPQGTWQPDFQCAEFVARALAAEGLIPGLRPDSPRVGTQSYAHYTAPNGKVYYLWNVGVPGVPGLYDYLIDTGLGVDVGNNPTHAAPGDVVFYHDVAGGNRSHTTLIVQAGSQQGSPLIDGHNVAAHDKPYDWFLNPIIVHLKSSSGGLASLNASGGGLTTPNNQTASAISEGLPIGDFERR